MQFLALNRLNLGPMSHRTATPQRRQFCLAMKSDPTGLLPSERIIVRSDGSRTPPFRSKSAKTSRQCYGGVMPTRRRIC